MQVFYGSIFTSIFIVMVHGLVDDYLYSGWWVALAFFPVGMSMLAVGTEPMQEMASAQYPAFERFSEKQSPANGKFYSWGIVLVVALALVGIGLTWNKISAQWFANLGAVRMAKVELADYPANKWAEGERVGDLQAAKKLFKRSLTYDAGNRLAIHRLGLIKMSERDFSSASNYLARAYQQEPRHRGVIKNLGYSYAWLGEMEQAKALLEQIPEAQEEMNVYTWWWKTQGRLDLSANADILLSRLKSTDSQD
jgi:tetratricopeptide (TPR) repeat protein